MRIAMEVNEKRTLKATLEARVKFRFKQEGMIL